MPYKDPDKAKQSRANWKKNNPTANKIVNDRWRKNNKDLIARRQFKKKYNATDKQYDYYLSVTQCESCGIELTIKQRHTICFTDKCQDHDHDTGELRDVICYGCNIIEGICKDNPDRLTKVWEYMQRQRNSKI